MVVCLEPRPRRTEDGIEGKSALVREGLRSLVERESARILRAPTNAMPTSMAK